jgi:hypothetical protein
MADLSKGQRHDCRDLRRVASDHRLGILAPSSTLIGKTLRSLDLSARLCWRRITAGSALVNLCLSVDLAGNVLDL